ncbi:MAG: ABC transporter family substrate-binding protein, partial [Mycobacterium sp.]
MIALAVGLTLGGCSPAADDLPATGDSAVLGTTSDINSQNPATLREGGNLRLALAEFPSNFNTLHIDGNVADSANMLKATMPRAFVIGPDGSATV